MPRYMVSYDLKTPEKDYSALIDALQEGYRSYWHCLGSTWLIVADQTIPRCGTTWFSTSMITIS
jgi:hypothetical protein